MKRNIKWHGLAVLSVFCLCFVPTMGEIPILCMDDAYYWPGAEYYQTPFSSQSTQQVSPAEVQAEEEFVTDTIADEPYAEPLRPAEVTFTSVQDTVIKAVIKR
ncbi:MAG: hypothetical protein K6A36_00375 [Paludibacteraceae bacterium]|nr:hypothetical protein [Paludibacteraceae bacterium]